jgi:alkylation response protein AidB-like acyl-CoA dehydrogenase
MTVQEQALRALNRFASLQVVDRVGLRRPAERLVYRGTKMGGSVATRAGRTFAAAQKLTGPARQPSAKPADLFDLTPSDEQKMMQDAFGDFASEKLRPAAQEADETYSASQEILSQANELGITMVGVPEELGGAVSERSAVTSVLIAEALAKGDMGLAVAVLSPAAVSTAISLWGDADQQAAYLPAFTGEDEVPCAALAINEARPLFDPFELQTTAKQSDDGYVISGAKSLVPRAADAELFVVAADLEGKGPALFIVEAKEQGLSTTPEPAMGIRATATATLTLNDVKLGAGALLGDGDPEAYAECVRLARLGWCAVSIGTGRAVLDYVTQYVNERVAFGEPISHRQGVAFTVANMAIELEGMRLATYRAAALADQGKSFGRETAIARRLCTTKGMQIGSDGVQMLGGHGYTKEHPVERWYRDLRAAGVMEGALLV